MNKVSMINLGQTSVNFTIDSICFIEYNLYIQKFKYIKIEKKG
jgi:hypothetical protein